MITHGRHKTSPRVKDGSMSALTKRVCVRVGNPSFLGQHPSRMMAPMSVQTQTAEAQAQHTHNWINLANMLAVHSSPRGFWTSSPFLPRVQAALNLWIQSIFKGT